MKLYPRSPDIEELLYVPFIFEDSVTAILRRFPRSFHGRVPVAFVHPDLIATVLSHFDREFDPDIDEYELTTNQGPVTLIVSTTVASSDTLEFYREHPAYVNPDLPSMMP